MNRTGWKIGALFGVIVLVMLVAVPIASAHHPVVVASLACNGAVTFTVTADIQNSTRNNADVAVSDTSGGTQPIATGVFDAANNWSFSGTFTIPTTVTSDTLTPHALGIWGDGVAASDGPSTTITRPGNCPPAPVAPAPPAAPQPSAPAPAVPTAVTPTAVLPATAAQPPTAIDQPPARGSIVLPHPVAPFTPPTAAQPPVSGSTSLSISHVVAPFTPPNVSVAKARPKLVSHVPPKTAG